MNPFLPTAARAVTRRACVVSLATSWLGNSVLHAQPASGNPILIGQTLPQAGPMAPLVTGVLEGEMAAISDANQRGGIGGRPIKLLLQDDGFDPKRALQNARDLVEKQNVLALFGVVGTGPAAAVLPYVAEKKVPLIAVYSGSPGLRAKPNPYFFTTQASYTDELVKMVRNLMTVQSTRIAIVYQNNEFGNLLLPLAQKAVTEGGATVATSKSIESSGADAVAVAKGLAGIRPNAVIMIAAGPSVVAWVRACKAHIGIPVYTFSLSASTSVITALGDDARGLAVARVVPYPWQGINPLTREFHDSLRRNGKLEPDYDRFFGYINGRILIEGLRAAGRDATPQSLTSAMKNLGRLDLGGYVMNYSATNHHGSNFVDITVIGRSGKPMK